MIEKPPTTLGQMRAMLTETMYEVRYGHMPAQQGIAVSKIAAQVSGLIKAEIDAWKYLDSVHGGLETEFGKLPIHCEPKHKAIAG